MQHPQCLTLQMRMIYTIATTMQQSWRANLSRVPAVPRNRARFEVCYFCDQVDNLQSCSRPHTNACSLSIQIRMPNTSARATVAVSAHTRHTVRGWRAPTAASSSSNAAPTFSFLANDDLAAMLELGIVRNKSKPVVIPGRVDTTQPNQPQAHETEIK